MAACHALHTLKLSLVDTDFTRLHTSIMPFPALRVLNVEITGTCRADAVPATPLAPELTFYRGPAVILPLVLSGAQPEGLIITKGRAAEVLDALRTAAHPQWGTMLSMRVALRDVLNGAVLRELLGLCPHLAHLTLEISSDDDGQSGPPAATVLTKLSEIFRVHRALETIAFSWRLPDTTSIPDQVELDALLRREVPSLRDVVFHTSLSRRQMRDFPHFTTLF
ncbi:hypothetical protein B0H17DRAFT_1086691 [Mycena rosella]|uniref:Uncharacterized protein n=1 Tax=Mycena rosella TaxID=1033263 RepID=A0AAD7CXX8_MYCRO|nr:hypothetical protein B0H17DRAFT_1086691 [Mycena rosella]